MRSLKQYIMESVHTYDCTIKVAGHVDKNWLDMFKYNLKKFDPIEISEPKTTPIQKTPFGFDGVENEPVTIIKCKFRYPATEPMIQQIAQLLGYNVNLVRLVKTGYDESITSEMEGPGSTNANGRGKPSGVSLLFRTSLRVTATSRPAPGS